MNERIEVAGPSHPPLAGRKLEKVTAAARELFLNQGFSATSMDAIAKAASVSKATLYAYFASKEALFEFLIMAECEGAERDLPLPALSGNIRDALRTFARQYVRGFIGGNDVAFVRIVANESGRFPDLSRLFYHSGPQATIRRLAQFLDDARARGLLEFGDSIRASTQFLSLIRGELPLRTVLGLAQADEPIIDLEIESGLDLFLRACAPAFPSVQAPSTAPEGSSQ